MTNAPFIYQQHDVEGLLAWWKSLLDDPVVTPLLEGISPGCQAASEEYVSLLTEALFSPDTELTEDHRQTCRPCLTMLFVQHFEKALTEPILGAVHILRQQL